MRIGGRCDPHPDGARDGAANDIGVAWPPGRPPILVAVFCDQPDATGEARSATIAAAGRIVAEAFRA